MCWDRLLFGIIAVASLLFLLHRIFFSKKRTPLEWVIALGLFILLMVSLINPNNRVYSWHGFIHGAITYEILNGNIPPANPFLAGEPLLYPWGYHLLGAILSQVFNTTPFYAFWIINIFFLMAAMVLVFLISRMLIPESRSNILSVLISLCGVTVLDSRMIHELSRILPIPIEHRATPVIMKFFNINGTPLGIVFFLLFLFAVLRIFKGRMRVSSGLMLALSVLGAGFFYPATLLGLGFSAGLLCAVFLLFGRRIASCEHGRRKAILIAFIFVLCVLLLLVPYLKSISGDLKVQFFNRRVALMNALSYAALCLPLILVVFLNRTFLKDRADKLALTVLALTVVATFLAYVCTKIPTGTEYKSLLLSTLALGLLGGAAFDGMTRWCPRGIVFVIILIFLFPSASVVSTKISRLSDLAVPYTEKGRDLLRANEEENELYQWMREKTPKKSVFIDTEITLPIYGRRKLFMSPDKWMEPGFQLRFLKVYHNDPELQSRRQEIVKEIYSEKESSSGKNMDDFWNTQRDLYVVLRRRREPAGFSRQNLKRIFQTSQGNFSIYSRRVGE